MVSIQVYIGGTTTCTVCGVTDYTNINENGETAMATFNDPVPANNVIHQITVSTTNMYWCSTDASFFVLINNEFAVNNVSGPYSCACNACPTPIVTTGIYYAAGLPGYMYGQQNTLTAEAFSGSMGISLLTLEIAYGPSGSNSSNTTTGGNNVTVSISYDGCGFCTLCSGMSYALSNGGTDCGEGVWGNGIGVFEDPLPSGAMLTQVVVTTAEFFWCEAPAEANFTLGSTYIGSTGMIDFNQCGCDLCPDTYSVSSQVFQAFPGYKYGHQNMFQIGVGSGVVGVRSVELMLIFNQN
jgi:hypothetical protein